MNSPKNIVIFASGGGTNAENIITYFNNLDEVNVECVFCNNHNAGVVEKSKSLGVNTLLFNKSDLNESTLIIDELKKINPALIVLAGFLLKIPENLIDAFQNKIINIHPALLPKYGGKGMYGMHVHKAVVMNKEKQTGISIHYVNPHYDEGKIIFQASCTVEEYDTPEDVAKKIHKLEMEHFPRVIEELLTN